MYRNLCNPPLQLKYRTILSPQRSLSQATKLQLPPSTLFLPIPTQPLTSTPLISIISSKCLKPCKVTYHTFWDQDVNNFWRPLFSLLCCSSSRGNAETNTYSCPSSGQSYFSSNPFSELQWFFQQCLRLQFHCS